VPKMLRLRYLIAGSGLAVLLIAVAGISFMMGQRTAATDESGMDYATREDDTGSMMGNQESTDMGSMMNSRGMMGSQMMGSFDEEKPFDLQFIDQMIPHHEGAIMSSEHMISDSQRPELRPLYENIQKSQSEQIEQMQEWRKEWYPDAEQTADMPTGMSSGMMQSMMGSGSMQDMMGGDVTDAMFLRMMIPHHQMAVDMSQQALERAEHPELKELAQTIIDEQSAEIQQMRGYLEEIDPTNST
jgi:uncharacterized protein (DUF305 family)